MQQIVCLLAITYALLSLYMAMRQLFNNQISVFVSSSRSGQAMVEYVVIAGILLASFAIFYLFEGTFKEFGARVLSLIGSEYP